MSKDTYIRVRLTTEEKKEIRDAADRNKTNMSDYILSLIRKETRERS